MGWVGAIQIPKFIIYFFLLILKACPCKLEMFCCVVDESPRTCNVFLTEQGLELFMNMLRALEDVDNDNRVQVETKILGLLVRFYFFIQ
jgi:hypothetical protein